MPVNSLLGKNKAYGLINSPTNTLQTRDGVAACVKLQKVSTKEIYDSTASIKTLIAVLEETMKVLETK